MSSFAQMKSNRQSNIDKITNEVIPFKHSYAVIRIIEQIENRYRGTKDGAPFFNPNWSKK